MENEDRSKLLLRAYRTLAQVLEAVDTAGSEAELLADVCRIAVEDAGYRLAWVGYRETDEAHSIRPVAEFGFDEGYLASLHLTFADEPHGRGPTGTAIRTGAVTIAQNILTDPRLALWREEALKRGYAASLALPLHRNGDVFGALSLYASEPGAFDADELELLGRVANGLSRGILCARGRMELGRMQQILQQADRFDIAARVAATIAHDVNNCLTVVMPCLDELKEHPAAADARAAVNRAVALNRQLLSLAPVVCDATPMSVDTFVSTHAPLLQRVLAPFQLSVEPAADPWEVRVDAQSLDQLVTNLVLNARDALELGGEVTIRTAKVIVAYPLGAPYLGVPPGDYVAVRVTDTGRGIAPEAREHMFEPFFTTKGARGTGLGLTSVLGIARRSGGNVFVESELGKGTTFEVLFPRSSA